MQLKVKRVYEEAGNDGFRVLADRLWPRGLSRQKALIDYWAKDIAPSNSLRRRFHADGNWNAFIRDYMLELEHNSEAVKELSAQIEGYPLVTLLYASKDEVHNNAAVLRIFLQNRR